MPGPLPILQDWQAEPAIEAESLLSRLCDGAPITYIMNDECPIRLGFTLRLFCVALTLILFLFSSCWEHTTTIIEMSTTTTTTTTTTATPTLTPQPKKRAGLVEDAKLLQHPVEKTGIAAISQGMMLPGIPSFTDMDKKRRWMLEHMAGAFRVFARKGFTEGMSGHISLRDPEHSNLFWTNP